MTRILLTIIETVLNDSGKVVGREVSETPVWFDPTTETARWLTELGATPWRNGWQKHNQETTVRVSFEHIDRDELARVIRAISIPTQA